MDIDTLDGGDIAGSFAGSGAGSSITNALPDLLFAYQQLTDRASESGITFTIADFGGLRTQADTNRILGYRDADWASAVRADPSLPNRTTKEKWRKIAPWGHSMHNYGAAFDVVIDEENTSMPASAALRMLQNMAPQVGLVSGVSFGDPPHFELPGGLPAAKVAWEAMTGTAHYTGSTTLDMLLILVVAFVAFILVRR